MKKRVVIYARFSSHSQTEQSIEGQLRECYEYAKRQDLLVVAEYIDRALTGTTDKRPEFLRMIDDSKKKTFDYVLVYQLDRFARNRYDSANYKAKLKKNGVRVLSAKENITEDASGILIEGVLESMAEYYSVECFYGHYLYNAPIYLLSSSRCSTAKIVSQRQKIVTENI